MLYNHEYKVLLKIKEHHLSSNIEYGITKEKIDAMFDKKLIYKEYNFTDRTGKIYYKYLITDKGNEEFEEYDKYFKQIIKNELDLDLKDMIDYLLGINDLESRPGSKYDIYRLLNKKYLTIHEVGKHPLGKTFRFELTKSGEREYEKLLEKLKS